MFAKRSESLVVPKLRSLMSTGTDKSPGLTGTSDSIGSGETPEMKANKGQNLQLVEEIPEQNSLEEE